MYSLDSSKYKTLATSRNLTYSYFVQLTSQPSLPTLLLLHGFPCQSADWHHQIAHFSKLGYGLIVPDLLGYGGTDKPTDAKLYGLKGMAGDVKEILEKEHVDSVVVVGHDWGSALATRLMQYHPTVVHGLALLAVGYYPPTTGFEYDKVLALCRATFGSELFGYWKFFSEEDAEEVVLGHLDSMFCLSHPANPALWREWVAPLGAMRKYLLEDRTDPIASYFDPAEIGPRKEWLRKNGLKGAVCWYKAVLDGISPTEDAAISHPPSILYTLPVFLGAASKDYVCLAPVQEKNTRDACTDVTLVNFDSDHWLPFARPEEVNRELEKWLVEKVVGK